MLISDTAHRPWPLPRRPWLPQPQKPRRLVNRLHVVPPCTATVDEVTDGLAILDEALTVANSFYTG